MLVCIGVCVFIYVCTIALPKGGQKRISNVLELKLQVVVSFLMWVLETKFGVSGTAAVFLIPEPSF